MKITAEKVKGKYSIKLNYINELTGKRKRMKIDEASTKEEADLIANQYRERIANGENLLKQYIDDEKTLGDCILIGLEKEYKRKNKKAGNTYISYTNLYERHIKDEIGDIYIKKLKTSILQDFLDKKAEKYAQSTVSSLKAVIKKGIRFAIQDDMIDRDLTTGLVVSGKEAKTSSKINVLKKSELKEILRETKGTELGLQIMLAGSHGLRLSEVLGISWENVDFDERTIKINQIIAKDKKGKYIIQKFTKNKEELVINMTDMVYESLKEYKIEWNKRVLRFGSQRKNQLLFCKRDMSPLNVTTVSNNFSKYMTKKGHKNVSFHGLRHTFATMLYDMGYPLGVIGKMLNHKDPNLAIKTYIHLSDERKEDISNQVGQALSI